MAKSFAVEVWPMKVEAVQNAAKAAATKTAGKSTLQTALSLFDEAVEADDYDAAELLARSAEAAATKAGISSKGIQPLAGEAKRLHEKYAQIKPDLERLAEEPKDAKANRVVGSFRCFEKGDWERGLPLLALGDDPKLRGLAEQDRTVPKSADERKAFGDHWRSLTHEKYKGTEKYRGAAKRHILHRACYWYGRALPEATEKTLELAEKGIRFFTKERDNWALAWGHLVITQATPVDASGSLHLSNGGKSVSTLRSYSGPIEVTVLARAQPYYSLRLLGGRGAGVVYNWKADPKKLRVYRPDGKDQEESGTALKEDIDPLLPNTWYLLTWRITEQDMTVEINGSEVFTDEHKNDLSKSFPVRLGTFDSDIEVLSFTVRPIRKAATEAPKLAGNP
jgi:hypothetical protein